MYIKLIEKPPSNYKFYRQSPTAIRNKADFAFLGIKKCPKYLKKGQNGINSGQNGMFFFPMSLTFV